MTSSLILCAFLDTWRVCNIWKSVLLYSAVLTSLQLGVSFPVAKGPALQLMWRP